MELVHFVNKRVMLLCNTCCVYSGILREARDGVATLDEARIHRIPSHTAPAHLLPCEVWHVRIDTIESYGELPEKAEEKALKS